MNDVQALKAQLIQTAYIGAVGVCGAILNDTTNPTGSLPIDALIQDQGLQAKGVMLYEEAKIQYAVLLKAFADKTGIWPDPILAAPAPATKTTPATTATTTPATGVQPTLQAALAALTALLTAATTNSANAAQIQAAIAALTSLIGAPTATSAQVQSAVTALTSVLGLTSNPAVATAIAALTALISTPAQTATPAAPVVQQTITA